MNDDIALQALRMNGEQFTSIMTEIASMREHNVTLLTAIRDIGKDLQYQTRKLEADRAANGVRLEVVEAEDKERKDREQSMLEKMDKLIASNEKLATGVRHSMYFMGAATGLVLIIAADTLGALTLIKKLSALLF